MAPIKRKNYTVQMKNEAIQLVNKGTKRAAVQAQYGISSSTLTDWIKAKVTIAAKLSSGKGKVKRLTPCHYPKTEEAVRRWFTENRNNDVAIDGATFRVKAIEFSQKLGEPGFNGSAGWLTRVKQRNDIVHRTISGEANSVDPAVVDEFRSTVLVELLNKYAPKDIYNGDEAALQYHQTSKKTLAFKKTRVHGRKQLKQRVTLLFCANMDGSDKKKMLVIGHFNNPHCMGRGVRRPCPYRANKKAWMTSQMFEDYLRTWDRKLTTQRRRIALVIDNATCHPKLDDLVNIELVFLPPNTTSHTQPMDQGVIANFKRHYRFLYTMGYLCPAVESGKKLQFNILNALNVVVQAWDMVTPRTISRCFRKAGFSNVAALTPEEEEEEDLPLSELARRLNSAGQLTEVGRPFTVDSLDHVLTEDEGLETTGIATVDDIVSEMQAEDIIASDDVSDDEAEHEPPTKPPHSEFMKCLEVVERYWSFDHGPDGDQFHLLALQMQACAIRKQPNRTQTTLERFFTQQD